MVFSSHLFLFGFLGLVLALYYAVPGRGREIVLLLLSYLFYAWANPLFVLLMLGTTAVNYGAGRWMDRAAPAGRKRALALSVIVSLGALGFFKYFNFGIDSFNATVTAFGLEEWRLDLLLRVVLPLGLSFYTFQAISYAVDVYRREAPPVRDFLRFATYISLFPQLVAGPIVRFREIAAQLESRSHTREKFARGCAFFALGLAKKVLLANPCGRLADAAFGAPSLGPLEAWTGLFGYSFQIYFDFSGYSDMAIGLGLMFGFVFPKNFDSPYRAASITAFWQRWHLSLSHWLRDYLYIPLGGNRLGPLRTYANLFAVMLLGGLWHGASWNFVAWGAGHGVLLAGERARGRRGLVPGLPAVARVGLTFLLVSVLWVFFRAPDFDAAFQYLGCLVGLGPADPRAALLPGLLYQPYLLLSLGLAAVITWLAPQTWSFTRTITPARAGWILGVFLLAVVAMESQSFNPFIYFIF